MLGEDASGCRSIVERNNDDVGESIGRDAARTRDRLRVRSTPALARHANADVIAGAVIAALDLGNFGFARIRACRTNGQHHAFCTAVGKTQALHRGYRGREQGRQLRLRTGRVRKRRASRSLGHHCGCDLGIAVAQNERGGIVVKIEATIPIQIIDGTALTAFDIKRERGKVRCQAGIAACQHLLGLSKARC